MSKGEEPELFLTVGDVTTLNAALMISRPHYVSPNHPSPTMAAEKRSITVAIIGSGLGGVCASTALGKAGYDGWLLIQPPRRRLLIGSTVHVFEQASSYVSGWFM